MYLLSDMAILGIHVSFRGCIPFKGSGWKMIFLFHGICTPKPRRVAFFVPIRPTILMVFHYDKNPREKFSHFFSFRNPCSTTAAGGWLKTVRVSQQRPRLRGEPLWKVVELCPVGVEQESRNWTKDGTPKKIPKLKKHVFFLSLEVQETIFLNGLSVKTIVLVVICTQQFQGTILSMFFDFLGYGSWDICPFFCSFVAHIYWSHYCTY